MNSTSGPKAPRKPGGNITDRLMRGAVWIVAARIFTVGALMAHTIIMARLLTPAAFGLATLATSVAAIVEISTKQSLTAALIQIEDVTPDHINTAFTLNLVRGVIIGGAISLAAWPMAWIYNDDRIADMLLVLAASTSLFGISNPMLYTLTRDLQFWQELARTMCERGAVLLVSIPIAFYYHTHWAIIAGVAAGQISLVVSSFFFVPYRPRLCLKRTRDLLSFSIWVTLSQMLGAVSGRIDALMVGYLLGPGPVGILAVSGKLADAPTKETSMPLLRTAFPGFSKLGNDMDKLRPAYQRVQGMVFLVSFPAAIGLALVAEQVVLLFLGEKWLAGVIVIQLMAVASGMQGMASAVNPLAMSQGFTRTLFLRNLFNTAIRLPVVLGGLFAYGLIGLLVARLINSTSMVTVNMNLVRQVLGLSFAEQLSANARTFLATMAMALTLLLFDVLHIGDWTTPGLIFELVAMILLGAASFFAVLFGLWIVARRPIGPEQEIIRLVQGLRQRLGRRG